MAIEFNDNLHVKINRPTDFRFGPFTDINQANTTIPIAQRYHGLLFGVYTDPLNIATSDIIYYYYWDGLSDTDIKQLGGKPPVDGSYANQAAMIAAQATQTSKYLYYDGTSYWEYLGTTNGDITDYRFLGGTSINNEVKTIYINEEDLSGSGTTEQQICEYINNNITIEYTKQYSKLNIILLLALPSNCIEIDITTLEGLSPESNDIFLDFEVFESTSSTITVDWGDGTQISTNITSENQFYEPHRYLERGATYTIHICFSNIENIMQVKWFTGAVCGEEDCINSLTETRGIQNFISLVELLIDYQRFVSFDVSGMNTLELLDLSNNDLLSHINFGEGLPNLEEIELNTCNFSGDFDFTIFPNINEIRVQNNNFTSINASNLLNLEFLNSSNNPNLSNLDITGSPSVQYIFANNCAIPTIQVDSILVQLDTNGVTDGTVNLSGGTNGIPTATGLAAKISLEGKGWTVTVNI
jgi:hypothetical protein